MTESGRSDAIFFEKALRDNLSGNKPNADAEIHRHARDVGALGEAAVNRAAVGAQHGIRIDHRRRHGANSRGVGFGQNGIGGGGTAVARHQHRDLFAGEAALAGGSAASAGRGGRCRSSLWDSKT